MKKAFPLLLSVCASNYLYGAAPALSAVSDAGAFAAGLCAQTPAAASPYDRFMANWQANPNFEQVDEDYSFGGGHTCIGFKTRSNQASAIAEQDTPTMWYGMHRRDVINVEWCIKHAYTGSFVVLQKFNTLAQDTFSNDQKKVMNLLMAMHKNQDDIKAYINGNLSEKTLKEKLEGSKEQKNWMMGVF